MGERIVTMRLAGDLADGKEVQVDCATDETGTAIPPAAIHTGAFGEDGRFRMLIYRLARHDHDGMLLYEYDSDMALEPIASD